ncbi:glutamate--tRNA ligase family protein [uncultured Ruminococcus sp.]|uniref:glutamate--tRNA ligase n=1 Tax=uncultured Ruminococcus sp. TaxID=165186 RepID=UPI0025F59A92|nr:glutamate--tRNA ligase family protein [uncultured Ruminococcus sp.]
MDYKALADYLFPDVKETPEDIEARFPERQLPAGANVTRIGPSPTGFVHLGNLYNAIIGERIAHQSQGVFYLRIEDTDNKREVEGAVETVINAMDYFGVHFDEGATAEGDNGSYGPYRQRQRKEIYHVFAKLLTERGLAYPCFMTAEEIEAVREQQTANKENPGVYGKYAKCRDLSLDEIKSNIEAGREWVLRFRGQETGEIIAVEDAIRGKLEMPRNNMDFVLLKSDGIPTYHFAHVIDDHFMRSTHVIRGEEWISSLPMHVELFNTLGWKQPVYCHTATLMKMDGESKRKLSKRKDPELALAYYQQEGISKDAVWEFLLTLLNSNYEEWRIANPEADYHEFPYTLEKMSVSGALVDLDKMRDISKNVICRMTAEQVRDGWLEWCSEYNSDFAALINKYPERTLAALNVGRGGAKPRRDIETWKQACDFMSFYYDETFRVTDDMPEECDEATVKDFFGRYLASYDHSDDSAVWFDKVKAITEEMGFAVKPKDYKKNPEQFRGSIVHITNMLRIALTGHANAPDIWEVSHVLGEEITRRRLEAFA